MTKRHKTQVTSGTNLREENTNTEHRITQVFFPSKEVRSEDPLKLYTGILTLHINQPYNFFNPIMNQRRYIIRSILVASAALSCNCMTKSFGEEATSQDASLKLAKDALDNGVHKSMPLEEWEPKCFRMEDVFKLKNPLGVRQELACMGMLRVNMLSKDGQCLIGSGVDDNFYAVKSLLEFLSLSLVENVQLSYGSQLDHIFTWNKDEFELEQRTLDSDVHRDVHSFESRTKSSIQFGSAMDDQDSVFSILTVFGDREIVQNKREEQQKPILPVIVEFPYIGEALVSMKPCEVLFLVGNQWQRSLEYVDIRNQKDFDSSILPRRAKYSISDFHDRPSLLFVLKGSEERRTDTMVDRRRLKVTHQPDLHEKSLGNMDMDMDMDDMDHDTDSGTSFCSGGGMIMNMVCKIQVFTCAICDKILTVLNFYT